MEMTLHVILTLFMILQRFGTNSINTRMINSSNVTCIQSERQSLLVFRQGLVDESNRLSTWTGVECCEWHGVWCDRRNGHVVKLDLRSPLFPFKYDHTLYSRIDMNTSYWLRGEVSPSLLNLEHLRYLDLSMNNFSGQNIPEFLGSFKFLEYLNLSHSRFVGVVPPHLGNLSRLQYLDLSQKNDVLLDRYGVFLGFFSSLMVKDNLRWVSTLSMLKHLDLSGLDIGNDIDWFHSVNMLHSLLTLNLASCGINIPSIKFINFTSLNSLDLSSNYINSMIPVWLSNLTGLMHLNLHENDFRGQVPAFIGTLSSLVFIDLSSNQFNTSKPDFLWNLSSLVSLDLSRNKFHGPIPADVKLCNLSILNLSGNKFVGDLSNFIGNQWSDCLHNRLKYLNLGGNEFTGSIPSKIGDFKKLEHLILSSNALSGPISPSLGGLSYLIVLDLSYNQLNGTIPASFGQLSRLESLSVSHNQLIGNIPTSLGQLSNLETLDVSDNSLAGVLSEIHFTKLNNLTDLDLSKNSLTLNISSDWIPPFQLHGFDGSSCNLGPQFPNLIRTSVNLDWLGLSNSSIKDTIPEWFDSISSQISILDLSHNQIHGNLPRFHGYNTHLINLKSNKFEGSITSFPKNVGVLDLSDNLLTGHVPHTDGTTNSDLSFVNLSQNRLTGSIPADICKMIEIGALDLSNNSLSGILPDCFQSLVGMEVIDLSNNNITGVVPSSLGSLSSLLSLHFQNNKFEGDLPTSLQNLTSLVTMDLGNNLFTGSIPLWMGENLPSLRILNLQSNNFMGKLPPHLCQLSALQVLNLAHNNIIGTIPHCFGNLSGMITDQNDYYYSQFDYYDKYFKGTINYEENIMASTKGSELLYTKTTRFLTSLDISSNNITGEIPDVLMHLVGLENLNLSGNLLQGKIPKTIGNLTKIESLDLSINKLSGQIPQSLTSLTYLSYLNLSFNNLSGSIPTGNQLQTLNESSIYEGNIGLCGPPLSRSCNGRNDSLYNHVDESEGQDDNEGFWFYIGMGPGFAAGFIGLLGSLHFIRSWRITYFETLENVYGWSMVPIRSKITRLRKKLF
uniref:receptor-like protein EIX2 n=1 Tax=Erigeron canadensis TaxID=72917 RepID=UPI001CB93DB8|nr:receptor-like protein EIX2 [Erigeron canadensis]